MNKESKHAEAAKETESQTIAPALTIVAQYIKDLSFETPEMPKILFEVKGQPALDVNVDIKADHIKDNSFEVLLSLKVRAKYEEKHLFVCELMYGGLVNLSVPKEHVEPMLLVEVPRLMFPFARQIVAEMTREGGFAPVMLSPIDFFQLYRQKQQYEAQQEEKKAQIN